MRINPLNASALIIPFILTQCTTSLQEIATPTPTLEMAEIAKVPYASLQEGHRIYLSNCNQCHEHKLPDTTDIPGYHAKIHQMADLAVLSESEEKNLQLYLDQFTDR